MNDTKETVKLYTYDFIETMATWTGPTEFKPEGVPEMKGGSSHELLFPIKKLALTDKGKINFLQSSKIDIYRSLYLITAYFISFLSFHGHS